MMTNTSIRKIAGRGKRALRNFLRKLFRIRAHEALSKDAYKAPARYFRGALRLLSASRRQARRAIVNSRWPADRPMVSVIIPCYNYGHYVKEAVQSVLDSTWADLEIIVVEGGSTDGTTPAVVRSLEGGKTRCIYQSRRCYECENRFFGLQHVRGKYILFLDADDIIAPTYIETAVYLMETTGVDVVVPDVRIFTSPQELEDALLNRPGKVWEAIGLHVPRIFEENTAPGTSMFRYSFWKDNDIGMCTINSYAPDWDFWMRLASHGARYIHLNEPHHIYRQHGASVTFTFDESTRKAHMEMVRQRFEHVRTSPDRLEEIRYRQTRRPRVKNPRVNLEPRKAGVSRGELNILVCVPWFDNFGVSVLLASIFGNLAEAGIRVTVVATDPENEPALQAGKSRFVSFTKDCFCLATCLPEGNKADFLAHLVRSREIDLVLNNGSRFTYEMLGRLRRENPKLGVVDHLFNTVGHVASNREFAEQIDLTIVANSEIRKALIGLGEDDRRIKTIHHGIDVESFKPQSTAVTLGRGRKKLTFGFLGRLSEEKRPEYVVEMAQRFPEYHFRIAGSGPLHEQLTKVIRKARVGDRIELLGNVASTNDFYQSIDVLLIPSRIEGLPLVLLEAMALEIPVIAADVGMIGEVIDHGSTGFTFPAGDLEAMAGAIKTLASMSADERSQMGRKARAKAVQNHSLKECSRQYRDTFRSVVNRRQLR